MYHLGRWIEHTSYSSRARIINTLIILPMALEQKRQGLNSDNMTQLWAERGTEGLETVRSEEQRDTYRCANVSSPRDSCLSSRCLSSLQTNMRRYFYLTVVSHPFFLS